MPAFALLIAAPAHAQDVYGPPDTPPAVIVDTPPPVTREERQRRNWHRVMPAEVAWQVLNAVDTVQTELCIHHRPHCHETNSLIGRDASTAKIVAFKAGMGIAHWLVAREASKHSPIAGFVFEAVTVTAMGRTVISNWRLVF